MITLLIHLSSKIRMIPLKLGLFILEFKGGLNLTIVKSFSYMVPSEPEPVMLEARHSLQHMESMGSGGITLHGYYGAQHNVQLKLMEPPHDGYYVNQQSMQRLGRLNSLAPTHDGFFEAQQSIHGLGHLDFRPPSFGYSMQALFDGLLFAYDCTNGGQVSHVGWGGLSRRAD